MTRNTPKIPSIHTAGTRALIVTLCLSLAGVAMATDVEREQRLVAELEARLFDGDLQRLSAGKSYLCCSGTGARQQTNTRKYHATAQSRCARELAETFSACNTQDPGA